jgi:hypothetical protein
MQTFSRTQRIARAIAILGPIFWPTIGHAQSDHGAAGQSTITTTTGDTTAGASIASAQLRAAASALQELLQSGNLTAARARQVVSLLSAMNNTQTGSTLSPSQVRQINSAITANPATSSLAARTAATGEVRSGALSAQSGRQVAALSQHSAQMARRRGR